MQRLQTIGRYVPREPLGAGGFATVYRAYDPVLDRLVALKVLHPHLARDREVADRFVREGRALARVRHPNIVQVHDAGEGNGAAWIAMELVEGRPLDQLVRSGGPLPLPTLVTVVQQIAAALTAVHERGLVHRDVKPENILIEAGTGRAVLLDLGLARMADSRHGSVLGLVEGTPAFMAPEQVLSGGQVTPRTDVYQLAATVLYLLTGVPPFAGSTVEVLGQIATRPPTDLAHLRPDLPVSARAVLLTALAKDPAHRPETPLALAAALCAELSGVSPAAPVWRPVTAQEQAPPPDWAVTRRIAPAALPSLIRRRRVLVAVPVAVALVAGAVTASAMIGRAAGTDDAQARAPSATAAVSPIPVTASAVPAAARTAATTTPAPSVTAVPARTITPSPTPARTPTVEPTSRPGFDLAAALMRAELFRRGLSPAGPMVQTPAPGGTLYAQAGACMNRDPSPCQTVLFLLDRRVIGTDTPRPTNAVRTVRAAGQGQIAVVYANFARNDPDCCPSLPDVTVTYTWNGSRLVPSGQPPNNG